MFRVQIELERDRRRAERALRRHLRDRPRSARTAARAASRPTRPSSSGLAPGRFAETEIVGNSTCGSGATGRKKYAMPPASASATVRRLVPIGRRMNGVERLIAPPPAPARARLPATGLARPAPASSRAGPRAIEGEIDDRRRVERQELAEDESAHDRDAERPAQLRAGAAAERERDAGRAARPSSS